MRKNHQPNWLILWHQRWQRYYTEKIVQPQFESLGQHPQVLHPRYLKVFGHDIHAGAFLHVVTNKQQPVKLTTWRTKQYAGRIQIGDYCLLAPGVEITSAVGIHIGHNSMIAAGCVLSDSDWHGLYNRVRPFRCTQPITLKDNVWLGARTIVCKGVTIGENSVVGAGSVVTRSIPDNCVAAGNPAKVVKTLNPKRRMLKRDYLFQQVQNYWEQQTQIAQYTNHENTLWRWLKTLVAPTKLD